MADHQGLLFLVTAPSGGGKTSLVRAWRERDAKVTLSVSHTTRVPRASEVDGEHYHFMTEKAFEQAIEDRAFLEYAQVFGHYYGTAKHELERIWQQGHDAVLEIDWQGAEQVKRLFPNAIWILVVPPNVEILEQRLLGRNLDTKAVIKARMQEALGEMACYRSSDYVVVNDDFEQAVSVLQAIGAAARCQSQLPQIEKKMAHLLQLQ